MDSQDSIARRWEEDHAAARFDRSSRISAVNSIWDPGLMDHTTGEWRQVAPNFNVVQVGIVPYAVEHINACMGRTDPSRCDPADSNDTRTEVLNVRRPRLISKQKNCFSVVLIQQFATVVEFVDVLVTEPPKL